MAPAERGNSFRVRMSADEVEMLRELADRDGITSSDYVRIFIRRAHAEAFGAEPKHAKKPARK